MAPPSSSSAHSSSSFLSLLPFHPAFGLTPPAPPPSRPPDASQSKSRASLALARPLPWFPKHSLLAMRGDDLVVAGNDGLAALGLAGLRRAWDGRVAERVDSTNSTDSSSIEETEMPSDDEMREICARIPARRLFAAALDFSPRAILLNATGRLLAVAGDKELCVVVLPNRPLGFSGLLRDSDSDSDNVQHLEALELRSFRVGEFHLSTSPRHSIVKSLWHPLSDSSSCLCVLTSEGILRFYDLTASSSSPCLTLPLLPSPTGLTPPAVSFSIPHTPPNPDLESPAPFSGLTVYGLNQAGDIYLACPVLPPGDFRVDSTSLHALVADPESSDDLRGWARSALNQSIPHPKHPPSLLVSLTRPLPPSARQGPLKIQPEPPELAGGVATDLHVVERNDGTRAWFVIWGDGKLEFGVDVASSLDPKFANPDAEEEEEWSLVRKLGGFGLDDEPMMDGGVVGGQPPPLLLLASLSISPELARDPESAKMGAPTILQDPMYDDSVLISHAYGVHSISTESLLNAAKEGRMIGKEPPVVSQLVDTTSTEGSLNPVLGLVVTDSPRLERAFLAAAARGGAVARRLPLRIRGLDALPDQVVGEFELSGEEESEPWVPLVTAPFRIPEGVSGLPGPVSLGKRGVEETDEAVLRRLAEGIARLREKVGAAWVGGGEVEDRYVFPFSRLCAGADVCAGVRMEVQRLHAEKAGKFLEGMRDRLDLLREKAGGLPERFESLAREQRRLRKKADSIVDIALDITRPELTKEERDWAREVDMGLEKGAEFGGKVAQVGFFLRCS